MWTVNTVLVIIAIVPIIVVLCGRTSDEHISIAQFLKASNVDGYYYNRYHCHCYYRHSLWKCAAGR